MKPGGDVTVEGAAAGAPPSLPKADFLYALHRSLIVVRDTHNERTWAFAEDSRSSAVHYLHACVTKARPQLIKIRMPNGNVYTPGDWTAAEPDTAQWRPLAPDLVPELWRLFDADIDLRGHGIDVQEWALDCVSLTEDGVRGARADKTGDWLVERKLAPEGWKGCDELGLAVLFATLNRLSCDALSQEPEPEPEPPHPTTKERTMRKTTAALSQTTEAIREAVSTGVKQAAVDEVGETLLVILREVTGYDFAFDPEHPERNELAKLVMAALLHALATNFEQLPYNEGVAEACELQLAASTRDLIQPRLAKLQPMLAQLAKSVGNYEDD